ncbi:MAG: hypothetical protein QM784_19940 [Polyangiaceae bacterium]
MELISADHAGPSASIGARARVEPFEERQHSFGIELPTCKIDFLRALGDQVLFLEFLFVRQTTGSELIRQPTLVEVFGETRDSLIVEEASDEEARQSQIPFFVFAVDLADMGARGHLCFDETKVHERFGFRHGSTPLPRTVTWHVPSG